jgi:hypothetical protein
MRLPWLAMLVIGGLLGPGCGKTVYRSHEAQFCSIKDDDDPFYECSPSSDLVCINTYSMLVGGGDAGQQRVPLYLCRLACDPGKDKCPGGEICCPGKIEGKTYDKSGGCVPESRCDNPLIPDGGFDGRPDGPGSMPAEAGGDRPADTADTADAPATPDTGEADAGADAPAEAGV